MSALQRLRLAAVVAAALLAVAGGGLLIAASGRVSVAASSGHSPPVAWFLHFTMRRAARAQAAGIEAPPLDDPALLTAAAPHFDQHCALCHGNPRDPGLASTGGTTPPPPPLRAHVGEWRARELFWIVRHGIKYTGMPAWPALAREDEVWAMVALLQQLPSLDATQYTALAGRGGCSACHGADGGGSAFVPALAGQSRAYLRASLDAYADGSRASGIMQAAVARLDAAARERLATEFAARPRAAPSAGCVQVPALQDGAAQLPLMRRCGDDVSPQQLAASRARGRAIAQHGLPQQGVPACRHCHGDARAAAHPRLDGLGAPYLAQQLVLFRTGVRGGRYAGLMRHVAQRLDASQIADVAHHYAAQGDAEARH